MFRRQDERDFSNETERVDGYEKGGPSVFKNFLFISQLFCCVFIKCCDNNFLGFVPFLIRCHDRHK